MLTSLCACYNEERWLSNCPAHFKPVLYRRYIDDTFLLFREKSHAPLFLDYLNAQHRNISFTIEHEVDNQLPFLDVFVSKTNSGFSTSVFRKSSFTGLGMSFFSFCAQNFKINAIKTLLHRAYNISSSYCNMHIEFEFLKTFFYNNGYPISLFNTHVKKFLSNKYKENNSDTSDSKEYSYVSLLYFGHQSDKLQKDLLKLLAKFSSVNFRIVRCNRFTIGSFFKHKDSLPMMSRARVIYNYSCPQCGAGYVGSTSRTLHVRVSEHRGISPRTGIPLSSPSHSSVRAHAEQTCSAPVRASDFSILCNSPDKTSLLILESLYIFKLKPPLNDMNSAYPLNIFT